MTKKTPYKGPGADSEEKHEPASGIDTVAVVESLKVLDPKWPIREADILRSFGMSHKCEQRKSAARMQTAAAIPSIEISLIEWMSGILSKIRILPDD